MNTDDSMKLNGSVKFLIKDGTIQKVGLVEYILKFAALFRNPLVMISPSTFSDLVNIPEGNFDKITGFAGFMRNISLNSLANRIPLSSRNDRNYYSAEISQLPPIDANEKDCQIFLTKVDGDVEHNNFISSLKKIK